MSFFFYKPIIASLVYLSLILSLNSANYIKCLRSDVQKILMWKKAYYPLYIFLIQPIFNSTDFLIQPIFEKLFKILSSSQIFSFSN